ncbi:MAG TPA: CsgG/HfaB family protein [Anaerolineae bacterium]|jgi:curli biogenesis system outer membrane secretion channel CsgG|nr:CsgG/HfaB family protein [Anaerolineae bacterium]
MRAVLVLVVTALLSSVVVSAFGAGQSPTIPQKPRVAVLEFDVQNGPHGAGSTAVGAMSSALVNSGRFTVYDRAQLATVLKEHKLALTGIVDPSTAVKLGKFTGVQIVVCGSVESVSSHSGSSTSSGALGGLFGKKGTATYSTTATVSLHCKAIDAMDGSIWKEDSVEGSEIEYSTVDASSLVPKAIQEAAKKFVETLVPPLVGAVVKVVPGRDGYFLINLGSKRGVTERSEFRVETDGEVIYDIDGKPLGTERRLICLAHPTKGGVDEKMAKLAPGEWRKDLLVWSWKEHRDWVSRVERGFRVIAQPRERG